MQGSQNFKLAADIQKLKDMPQLKENIEKLVKKNKTVVASDLFAKSILPG